MAFLDNSGDIILDAVLTDLGRKRMADGNFSITKFGCGDDEINYGTYDISHPSGSAYYDLEIMQTPVFEATTHLPVIKNNEKALLGSRVLTRYLNTFHLAVNGETYEQLTTETGTTDLPSTAFTQAGVTDGSKPGILLESGIDTNMLAATANNAITYLGNYGLVDVFFYFDADAKFINGITTNGLFGGDYFGRDSSGNPDFQLNMISFKAADGASGDISGFNRYSVAPVQNKVYEDSSSIDDDSISCIRGPRAKAVYINFSVIEEVATLSTGVRSRLWTDYGRTSQSIVGGSSVKYDILDTTVYVQGANSGATIQLPIRLCRYVSGGS